MAYEGQYFAVIEHAGCIAITSAVAQLTGGTDVVQPRLRQITVLPDRQHLLLSFLPCPLYGPSASEPLNYAFDRDVVVSNAVVQSNTKVLLTTSLLEQGTRYSLTISNLQDIEGNLLDPFMGSGSTIAAAEAIGYESKGLELDPEYFRLAGKAIPRLAALYPHFHGEEIEVELNGHIEKEQDAQMALLLAETAPNHGKAAVRRR